jgi:hypothetical protein
MEGPSDMLAIERLAPGRTDDVAQAALHRVVDASERFARALVEHLSEHRLGILVAVMDSLDDVVAAVLLIETNHVVNIKKEDGDAGVHRRTRFPARVVVQAARRVCASASA